MAEGGSGAAPSSLKGLREQMVAAAQALADERRNQSGVSPGPIQSAISIKAATKPVIDGSILRSEERQRLARERREEREKQHAVKETQLLEKEKKAKLQYEKQMEEKQRKLREQKLKEQQRRAAVEEKRKQKMEEEKEHYEAVVHRTLERSQRVETRQKRWSWGGSATDSDGKAASKRSTSSANLKQGETVINKRLSSSAALLNSPSKTSSSAISSPVHVPKVPVRSRSIDRLKAADASLENVSLEPAQKSEAARQSVSPAGRRAPSPSSGPRRSSSPANMRKRPPSPAATSRQKPHPSSPGVLRQQPLSPVTASKPAPIQRPSLTPNVLAITKKKTDVEPKPKERADEAGEPSWLTSERENPATASKTKEDAGGKTAPGTTTAEEAAKILAEKRRLAREQRERDDQERVQREEEERVRKEEMAQRALEEQAQIEEALRLLEEERRAEEEEQQKLAEEERMRKEQEEQEKMAEVLLQREEAEAKAQEEAERQRQERERIMQQNKQERLERKKNEEKSNEEDEGVDEDEELGLEKQDEPEKTSYVDSSLEGALEDKHSLASLQEESKMEPEDVFVNGGNEEEVGQRTDGNSVCFTQTIEASPPAKETVIKNSEILHVNEADHPIGFISNLNGKQTTWSFEEIIGLGVHPKSAKLSPDSIAADKSTQNLKDAAAVPSSPKLAFEEESAVNSLIQPIETASEL